MGADPAVVTSGLQYVPVNRSGATDTDPDIPPIPPHATFEQAKDAAMALLKGDPDRWACSMKALWTKAREILPNRSE
jgi:hypothetical protein